MIRAIVAAVLALNMGRHVVNVLNDHGAIAALLALIFLLAFGEMITVWVKVIISRFNQQ